MLWGTGLAIAMRMVLTFAVSCVLLLPGLRFVGAILLAYIGCKLIVEQAEQAVKPVHTATGTGAAITRIALADVVMSFDNVIAVAGVAQADPFRLLLGLGFSIAIMLALSNAILVVMSRFRWIVYVATGVLALGAANMMAHDLDVATRATAVATQQASGVVQAVWPLRLALLVVCLTPNYWWPAGRPVRAAGSIYRGRIRKYKPPARARALGRMVD